jgi:imidazolonepropionase
MHVTDRGIGLLRDRGVVATLLPGTTFFLGMECYAPARRLLDAGVEVAIATDRNPGSCTIESLAFICGLSCLRLGLSPLEALRAATAGGARALGLGAETGRIAAGMAADLVLWGVPHEAMICYEFANFLPRTVIVAGRIIEGGHGLEG